jgi:hypothetical protein
MLFRVNSTWTYSPPCPSRPVVDHPCAEILNWDKRIFRSFGAVLTIFNVAARADDVTERHAGAAVDGGDDVVVLTALLEKAFLRRQEFESEQAAGIHIRESPPACSLRIFAVSPMHPRRKRSRPRSFQPLIAQPQRVADKIRQILIGLICNCARGSRRSVTLQLSRISLDETSLAIGISSRPHAPFGASAGCGSRAGVPPCFTDDFRCHRESLAGSPTGCKRAHKESIWKPPGGEERSKAQGSWLRGVLEDPSSMSRSLICVSPAHFKDGVE